MASICVFCCTRIKSDNLNGIGLSSEEILLKFCKVIKSQFRINFINIIGEEAEGLYDKVCLKCEKSLKSISELYHELESIRLKMEWKFGELISKMEAVGRTPSKVKWLRRNQPANDFQKMITFRNEFISTCNQTLFKSIPTVILHRTESQSDEFPKKLIETNKDGQFPDFFNNSDDNPNEIDETTSLTLSDTGEPDEKQDHQNDKLPPTPQPAITNLHNKDNKIKAITKLSTKKHINCPHCPIKFSHRSSYRRHQKKHHPHLYQPKRRISQPLAPFLMPSILPVLKANLNDSKSEVNPEDIKLNDKLPRKKCFKCLHCPGIKFATLRSLSNHQIYRHQIPQTKKVRKSRVNDFETPNRYPCPICHQSIHKDGLKSHFNLNHSTEDVDPQNIHKCDHPNCLAYFRTVLQLQRHKRQKHDNNDNISRTTCPICGRICSEFGSLKFHMNTQHNDESPDLPIACDVVPQCPKRFPTEAILKWHRKYYNHSKREKSLEIISCPECQRECHGKPALQKHLKTHQKPEAPYVCELCGAAFKKKSILKTHELFHKGPDNWAFQCETCGKKCATKHKLRDHMQVHSDVKRYSCQCCGRGYNCRQKLREHVNKFHALEGFQDIPRKKKKPKLISRRAAAT